MKKKLYVISGENTVKIGVSQSPLDRLKSLQVGNDSELTLEMETDYCINAEDIETIAHNYLAASAKRGEWFEVDKYFACSIVHDLFSELAVKPKGEAVSVDTIMDFMSCIEIPEPQNGLYKINEVAKQSNAYRVAKGMGKIQIGNFFTNDSTKQAMVRSCIERKVPLSSVKSSSRGKQGGTFLDKSMFNLFLSWASGIDGINIDLINR